MVNEWSRADLPEVPALRQADDERGTGNRSTAFDIALDVVVDHLNARHPQPDAARLRRAHSIAEAERDQAREQRDLWKERAKDAACDRADAERSEAAMERQRDEANQACGLFQRDVHEWRARAEAAEKRHTWPKVTPTGHTYVEPRTYEALRHEHGNAAQAAVECWAADECPPEPSWEMVGVAHREVERIRRDRDEWKARTERAERERDQYRRSGDEWIECHADAVRERDEWRSRAEAAEVRTAPAVSRADVAEVLSRCLNPEMWNVTFPSVVNEVCDLFGIEAEQAADPVEAKAIALWRASYPNSPRTWEEVGKASDAYRRMAEYVLGQEAGDE